MSSKSNDIQVPVGTAFLELTQFYADQCEIHTQENIPTLGLKAPQCLERIGTAFYYLNRLASCQCGCAGGDHAIEYIVAKALSAGQASLRLARMAFYNESLSATRTVGEIANLLMLFSLDRENLDQWRSAPPETVKKELSPYNVRMKIQKLSGHIPVNKDAYELLCRTGTHANPSVIPQGFNEYAMPMVGGLRYQERGFLVCVNELAIAVAFVCVKGPELVGITQETQAEIVLAGCDLLRTIGGVTLAGYGEYQSQEGTTPSS